jgi:hypothetical protein
LAFDKDIHSKFLDLGSDWGDKKYTKNFGNETRNKAVGRMIRKHIGGYH